MQLESFCLAILLGREGGDEHTSQDQALQFCQTRSQELFFPYLFTSWDTQKPQREIGQGNGSQEKISKLLVIKEIRAFIPENGEFGTICANSHCISKCGIHSAWEPSEEGKNI